MAWKLGREKNRRLLLRRQRLNLDVPSCLWHERLKDFNSSANALPRRWYQSEDRQPYYNLLEGAGAADARQKQYQVALLCRAEGWGTR